MIVSLIGGLGVFLLGMVLLTDGLKAVAGEALRRILTRFVATPLSGVGWGALVTAMVQSSTATTLMTVGFVSAGLLTFTQAIGVILGANLGTTSTGWIVSQLGFKVSLGAIAPPLVLVGVAMRLIFKGKAAHAGTALAGFALLFMGIDLLQAGMSSLASRLSPGDLPGGDGLDWTPRLVLVGFGFVMTVIMQSSSASMTATLAAVASGAISLDQAAALAIGQNIGTTPTAVAAAIGAPTAAKRTAAAHVLFNVLTASVVVIFLPWVIDASRWGAGLVGSSDNPTILALFHTAFNLVGVMIVLPCVRPFARAIEWLFPDRGPRATRFLAPSVSLVGPIGLEAARRALVEVLAEVCAAVQAALTRGRVDAANIPGTSLREVVQFVHRLGRAELAATDRTREQSLLHACDHLERATELLERRPQLDQLDSVVARAAAAGRELAAIGAGMRADEGSGPSQAHDPVAVLSERAETTSRDMAELRRVERRDALSATAMGQLHPDTAMARIDALLWLDGMMYHLWRSAHHLRWDPKPESSEATAEARALEPPRPPAPDRAEGENGTGP
jgi:phosphate:Na+ symporter